MEIGLQPWSLVGTSLANTAQTVTKAAVAGKRHFLRSYVVAARGGTPGEITVTIKSGTTAIWTDAIRTANHRAQHQFASALFAIIGDAVSIEVAAGGSGVITEACLEGATT